MGKYILLTVIILMGLTFNIMPKTGLIGWFPFSDMRLTLRTHVYFIFEKLGVIFFSCIMLNDDRSLPIKTFFWLMIADLLDYLLCYNSVWVTIGIPISMNIAKVVIFGLIIFIEWYKSTGHRYFG